MVVHPTSNQKPRRAILAGLARPGQPGYLVEEHLDELADLAASAGVEVVGRLEQYRKAPDARTFIGKGKVEELKHACEHLEAGVAIFDDDLSPGQVKRLEKLLGVQVVDRSALILDIFVSRARTREARTQVELAQLNYMLPRLTRRWTHLSRQAGGIGLRGGEGEKQLEADRRMLRVRIKKLKKELTKIEKTREIQRRGRRDAKQVALAGYTNAGKSTLFNRLTRANVKTEDRLFATLDSRLRAGSIGRTGARATAIFSDTVGFIRKLPHHLVASFRSTLEEVVHADLVLHVIDRSHPQWEEQTQVAEEVLDDLGVDRERVLRVFNKRDLLEGPVAYNGSGVWISSVTGEGLDELRKEIRRRLGVSEPVEVAGAGSKGEDASAEVPTPASAR